MSVDAIDLLYTPYVLTPPHSPHTRALSQQLYLTRRSPQHFHTDSMQRFSLWSMRTPDFALPFLSEEYKGFISPCCVSRSTERACGSTPENTGEWRLFVLLSGLQAVTVNPFECSKKEYAPNELVWCMVSVLNGVGVFC